MLCAEQLLHYHDNKESTSRTAVLVFYPTAKASLSLTPCTLLPSETFVTITVSVSQIPFLLVFLLSTALLIQASSQLLTFLFSLPLADGKNKARSSRN